MSPRVRSGSPSRPPRQRVTIESVSRSGYNSPTPAVARARRAFERRLELERRRREADVREADDTATGSTDRHP